MADLLSLISGTAQAIGATTVAVQSASALGQDPRKMSWTTINSLMMTNPELGAQFAEIKKQYEAQKLGAKQQKQALKLMQLQAKQPTAPAPAPAAANNNLLLIGGAVLLAILLKGK